jgi:hypothetical protein
MHAPQGQPSLALLARIYPASRQRLHQIGQAHGRDVLTNPDRMAALLSRPTRLQAALSDPLELRRIKSEIESLTK